MRRIRSIQLGTLAMSVVAAPFVAHFWFLGMGYLSWALVATVVVAWLNVLWLRGHRDSRWGGHLAAAALFLLLVISNSTSGGFYDPNLGWLYTVPMVATFFDDLRAGWIWVGIVLVALIAFWLLPIFGIVVPDLVPPERHAVQSLLNRCLILVSLAVLASAFVKAYQRTEDALEEEVKERRRAESEIRDLLDDVLRAEAQMVQSEKMASLGQLVAGVAHEVNNPINFISCALPILRRDLASLGALADEAHAERREQLRKRIEEVLSTIDEGVRRTSEVVRNLRTFSRLGEAEIKLADLHEAIDVTLSLLRFELAERQVEVERCYGGIPLVECYISELNQVFMNLLINAVQAVPNDGSGKIGITTERADVGGGCGSA